ncbi:MAG: O-antigen ligase family protein [Candidatus Falkowbacteria bacterium]
MKLKYTWLIFSALLLVAALFLVIPYPLLIAISVGVLAILLTFSIKPEWGLYLLAFSLPLINWNFDWNSLSVSFVEILALLLLISFILHHLYFFFQGKNIWQKIKLPLWQPFLLFLIAAAISSLLGRYVMSSSWYTIRWLLFFYLAYLAVPYNIIKDGRILKNTIIALTLSGLGLAVMGIVSLTYQDWYNSFFRIQPTALFGIYPVGSNHNLIAEFLVIITFLVLSLKHWSHSLRVNRFINILFLFFMAVTFGTFSRTAWIVLGMGACLYLFLDTVYLKRKIWSSKNIIFAILISVVILVPFIMRMTSLQAENVSSTENRLLLTQIAWRSFLKHPIVGSGPGMFVTLVSDNVRFTAKYGDPLDSHGVWQKLIAEVGFLGTASFVIFIGLIFWNLYRALKIYKKETQLLLPLSIAVLGGFVYQFFNTSYYKGKLWVPIAVALAAMNLLQQKYAKKNK